MTTETIAPAPAETDANRVFIFDTTLRDGEQSPGCSMTPEEKMRMARTLADMGVDIIEAGFPIASNADFVAVNEIAKAIQGPTIAGLARAKRADIERAAEALAPNDNRRIHTFISTSPLHMKYKLQMEPEAVVEAVYQSVSMARNHTDNVEWSPEDGTRTEHDFLCRCVETAIKAGATTINIPDTVGYSVPDEFGALFRMLMERVPGAENVIFSAHCHNDLGLAVANSLAAVANGARQVECTINGIGERAGNAALEEIVMALRTRGDIMPYETGVDSTHLTQASNRLSMITQFNVQPNKAIVGANAFAHESGIHQDGMLKHAGTYEIMTPESVGLTKTNLVMGKHSGRHAFKTKLGELGFELSDNELAIAFQRFKDLADKKKDVYDDDIVALVEDEVSHEADTIHLKALRVETGIDVPPKAILQVDVDGDVRDVEATGDGSIDAVFNALNAAVPNEATLELYKVNAVTGGTDAQAGVSVRLAEGGKSVQGTGTDTDTLIASARAYVHALNKLVVKRAKTKPEDSDAAA